jgi:spermidine/putrescine transport system ATP-binding protein
VARFIGETNLFDATVVAAEKLGGLKLPFINAAMGNDYMAELDVKELGKIMVTTVDEVKPGQKVSFAIRPEKIVISKEKPAIKRADINLFQGGVDEPIYSGFQTKFYVKVNNDVLFRVVKQHAKYYDEGPDIVWKDHVYISWSAHDGYVVGDGYTGDEGS